MEENQVQEVKTDTEESEVTQINQKVNEEVKEEKSEDSEKETFQPIPDYGDQLESIQVEVFNTSTYVQDIHKNIEFMNYQLFFISLLLIIIILRGKRKWL